MTSPLDAAEVRRWRDRLLAHQGATAETGMVELIAELERLKSTACAVQADQAVALDHAVRAREAAQGVAPARQGRAVAAQVALARQESPHRAQMLLGLAKDLATDLPHTREALRQGRLNEHRAMIINAETGCLDTLGRARIDEDLCATTTIDGLGTKKLTAEIRRRTNAADPASVARRRRKAETERRLSIRPAPDTMAYVTALLPVAQGVAAFAALTRDADTLRATGDPRSKGQLMADLFVERLTGQTTATAVPITIDVIISDTALLAGAHEPAHIPGWGPVPAEIARTMIAATITEDLGAWVRRLYANPEGHLVAMSTRQRLATDAIADYLSIRDQGICRTPWCDAPARHTDHIHPADEGGPTTTDNTQSLCEACNHTKQAPGWHQQTTPDDTGRHTVTTTTPTGHHHHSRAPAPPTPARPDWYFPVAVPTAAA